MSLANNTYIKQNPESLERRPEARAFKVEDLLEEVKAGRVRIPPFQRPLRWERNDARHLLDSIYRGYPVGTLLFWEKEAEAGVIQFGVVTVSAGARTDALWVVDGQQRIVSLVRILLAPNPEQDDFALYFDLDKSEFTAPPSATRREEDPSRWLPMTEVLDSERLFQWLLRYQIDGKERRDRAIQLGKRIREYDIPAYLVRTQSENILREVFGRINSSGRSLTATEVFDALHGARSQTKPATIRDVADRLKELGFGRVEEKILYRLLRVLQGVDIAKGISGEPWRLPRKDAERAYIETADAASQVIQFLKQDVGIPHYTLLPYKQPFVTLGKFFHHHRTPQARSRELLARWLWRGALSGAHSGDSVSTRATLERIKPDDEDKSVQDLLSGLPDRDRQAEWPDVTAVFNFRYAASKLQALALLELKPRDFETGLVIDLGQFLEYGNNSEKLSVPSLLSVSLQDESELVFSVANRLAHPVRSGGLRQRLLAVKNPVILESHGISQEAFNALQAFHIQKFLELRAECLRPKFQSFFARHARLEEPDRPSLSSLIIADEDD